MYKVLVVEEKIGGSLALQAEVKASAVAKLEKKLNELPVEDVICVTPAQSDSEFQLVAVIKIATKKGKEDR